MSIDFERLKAPFPPEAISWRIMNFNGNKGLPFAHLDARDVMDRLDDVCGPANWQCKYSHAAVKTVCDIGINNGDNHWLWKADGGGDTDDYAEKGALSVAFKRAAVRWGIGRYLYAIKPEWITLGPDNKIPSHEHERLMGLLPNYNGVTVSPMTGQAKTAGKFWDNKSYNILSRLPKDFCDAHGDPVWQLPDTIVWLADNFPNFIDKAPSRLALTKLQADNLQWIAGNLPLSDREVIMQAFSIRATQFDAVKGTKNG